MIQCFKIPLTVLLVFLPFFANCQKIDSLKSLLPGKAGLERANLFYELAYEYVDSDYALAQVYSNEAFTAAKLLGDSLLLVKAARIGALALSRNNDNDSSVVLSLQILPIARRNSFEKELKHILNRLGIGYTYKGKYDSSLIYHLESLSLREKNGDAYEISITLNNIGFIHFVLRDYDKALLFFERSYKYKVSSEKKEELDFLLLSMGACYVYKGQFDLARRNIDKAMEICKESCSTGFLMQANFNLGLISGRQDDFEKAISYFSESYALALELDDVRYKLDNLANLLEIARKANKLQPNDALLGMAQSLLNEDVSLHRQATINLYHELFVSFGLLRNFEKMSVYQNRYIQLKDSVFNEELATNLMKVESEYLERENKTKIEAQAKLLELRNEVISRQRALNVVLVIVAILSVALIIMLAQNNKQKKRANLSLEQKVRERTRQLEANHNELLKALSERDLQVKRISADIKRSMATIKGLCQLSLQDATVVNAGQYIDKIEKASDSLQSGIHRTLGISEGVA